MFAPTLKSPIVKHDTESHTRLVSAPELSPISKLGGAQVITREIPLMQTTQLGFDYFNEMIAIIIWNFRFSLPGYPADCRSLIHAIPDHR